MGIENIREPELAKFHGSQCFYKHFLPGVIMSEGAHFLSNNGAGWLMDIIASYQHLREMKACIVQKWTLKVDEADRSAVVICSDGYCEDYHELAKQVVPFTDFPLKELEILCAHNGEGVTIYLPSED